MLVSLPQIEFGLPWRRVATVGLFIGLLLVVFARGGQPEVQVSLVEDESSGRVATGELELLQSGVLVGAATGRVSQRVGEVTDTLKIPLLTNLPLPVEIATVSVALPASIDPAQAAALARVRVNPLSRSSVVPVEAGVVVTFQEPAAQTTADLFLTVPTGLIGSRGLLRTIQLSLPWLLLALAIGVPLLVLAYAYRLVRRDTIMTVHESRTDLPAPLPPAVVGVLYADAVDERAVLATVLDLSERQFIRLVVDQQVRVSALRTSLETRDFEQVLSDRLRLLADAEATGPALLESSMGLFYLLVYDAAAKLGAFVEHPRLVISRHRQLGAALLLVSLLVIAGFGWLSMQGVVWLGCSSAISGLILLLVAPYAPTRNRRGDALLREWLALRNFLTQQQRLPRGPRELQRFFALLPYAVALQCEEVWMERHAHHHFALPEYVVSQQPVNTMANFRSEIIEPLRRLSRLLINSRDPSP